MPVALSRFAAFRNAFISGLLLLAPLGVTVWAFLKVTDFVGGAFSPWIASWAGKFLPAAVADNAGLVWDILGTLMVVLLVTLLGWVSRYVFGKYLLGVGDRFIREIPGVSAVYNTVKQIVATFGRQSRSSFSKVVLVEFPHKGVWSLGFLTNKSPGEAQALVGGEVWAVFVPTTPNPTSGFLLLVPHRELVELEMSVGDGMKMIISGGAIIPPWPPGNTPALPRSP